MAEFQIVMHNMARICKKYWPDHEDECSEDCPLYDTWCFNMDADFPQMDRKQQDMAKVKEVVIAWAEKHPAPVYPTWWEWMENMGVVSKAKSEYSEVFDTICVGTRMFDPIPADIAEKLGLKPKEG